MNMRKVVACVGILLLLTSVLPQSTRCALSCDVWVDGGCGSTHRIGERMNIYFEVNKTAYVELRLTYPDGSTNLMAHGEFCPGTIYYISGTVGEPAGKRVAKLDAWSGSEYDSDTCTYYGGKAPGKIRVESNPSGGTVYLDGSKKGTTPLTITDVSPGSYTIKIVKSGYKKWTKTVTVHSDETTYVSATLQEDTGSIHVTSSPSGAKCYLDGSYKGTTPLKITDISPGSHKITLKKDGYYEWEDSVKVYSGETSSRSASLQAIKGSLSVDSNVNEAFVYVDGDYKGTAPLYIEIPVGSYTIRVSADKYYDYTDRVTVEANRTTYVEASLEERPGFLYVESVPSGAEIYLNNTYEGKTPYTISVDGGTHNLVLKYDGHYDKTQYVDVYPDETTTEYITLQKVFWRTGSFIIGVPLAMMVLFAAGFWYRRKSAPPVTTPTSTPTKLKSTFESAARIARAPFVPIEMLLSIVLPEKENRCPICDKSLESGVVLECTHCNDEGFTCKFHEECWEEHKTQQKKNKKDGIRCFKHSDIYVPKGSIKSIKMSAEG